ncbi:MAG: metallopeptidase TldD-related protein [Phycisphaerae bacterium]|nr:metallopeptidase TldD-related protein [Phycisphaerae bacterium]
MTDATLDSVAAQLLRRTAAFECFRTTSRNISVGFEAGKLKAAQTSERGGVGLRVVVGGRVAVGGTPDLTAVQATIDSAVEAAAYGDPFGFAFAPASPAPPVDVFDPAVAKLTPADLVAVGRQAVEQLADLGAGATVGVSVDAGVATRGFANSVGQRYDYTATHYSLSISVEFFGHDDIFNVWESAEGVRADADLAAMIAAVRRKFRDARDVVPVGQPKQAIVLTPTALTQFLWPLASGLNGQSVADGVSPLADKRGGPPILPESLTLIDDSTLAGRPGSQPFDDEGVPAQRTVLIDRGRVTNFLLDLRNGAKLGLPSTASAGRGLTSPPSPSLSNVLLAPGDVPLDKLIGGVADGLLIETLLGVGQGNVAAGDYANPIGLAYKIRAGQVVGRVKNCSIAGNIYEDLKKVTAIEDRGHWEGYACLPHVRIDGLELAVE